MSDGHKGAVSGGSSLTIIQTPTITAGAYTTGLALGGLLTFAGAAFSTRKTGIILSAWINDFDSRLAPIDLVLFRKTFTAATDNGAFSLSVAADALNAIPPVSFLATNYVQLGTAKAIASLVGLGIGFDLTAGDGASLFGQLIIRGSATYTTTTSIQVGLHVLMD